jgi:DNA-binding CsgD family transcriptional regulator
VHDSHFDAIVERCHSGLDLAALRRDVLPRLRRAVPVDALWMATADPATLLFTQAYREEIPASTAPYFVENEFLADDVNKWVELARDRRGARTLAEATDGHLEDSARYRDVFEPLGLGDELRVALRVRGACWGFMCLHRERGAPFRAQEVLYLQHLAPHLADGIRTGLLLRSIDLQEPADAPGIVVLAPDGSVAGATPSAERWLEELDAGSDGVPVELHVVASGLRALDAQSGTAPRLRVRTRAGRWAVLHAAWLPGTADGAVAVIIEEATAGEVAPVVMLAYGLTDQERTITGLVCRGFSTREISQRLYVSANTVQDHLKSIFDKTGVRSRRELVVAILEQQYLAHR